MNKRTVKIVAAVVAFIVLIPIVLVGLFLVFEHVRGGISLARYKRELVAKDEIITPQGLVSDRPPGENGAPELLAAYGDLKKGDVMPNHYPPRMKMTPSGRAVVGFREDEWVEGKVTYHWDQLASELDTNKPALGRVRAALQKPVLDNELDHSQGALMNYTHLSRVKQSSQWFAARAQLELHDGETHAAADDLVSQIELVRALARDRIIISELVRDAIASIARTGTWEGLQADQWTDEDLARLQQAWEYQHFATNMFGGFQGELVFSDVSYQQSRESNHWAFQMLFLLEAYGEESDRPSWERTVRSLPHGDAIADFAKEQLYCRVWRFAWLDQNERHYLGQLEELLRIMRNAAAGKSLEGAGIALVRLEEQASHRNLYDRLRYPDTGSPLTLSRCVARAMRTETERSIVICAIALKRYSLRHGSPPPSLEMLAPEFLPDVPTDYMDGKPMKYRRTGDGRFLLYSVGEDGRDDGGDATSSAGQTNVRDMWRRKDFVWPAPALPEEVEEYRRTAAGN